MAGSRGVFAAARRFLMLAVLLAIAGAPLLGTPRVSAHTQLPVVAYQQAYPLSCEFASLYIITAYWGDPIYEDNALATTGWSANPHYGFRGNIWGFWGDTADYGIYAEALGDVAWHYGYGFDVSYGADANILTTYLDQNIPVIVWASVRYEQGWYEYDDAGEAYKIVPFEHVFVVYGYDDDGVYISDPGPGNYNYLTWDYFLGAWSIMDGMLLAVYPN